MPGLKQFGVAARWLRGRFLKGGLILLYHRIATPSKAELDPYFMSVSPNHFSQHLEVLRDWTTPVSLSDLVNGLLKGRVPQRAVAVTFDDGYADNLYVAKPLLERFQIPATVFVTTSSFSRMFWWDEMVRLLIEPATLPAELDLRVEGQHFLWRSPRSQPQESSDSRLVSNRHDFDLRRRLMRRLHQFLRPMDEGPRELALRQLRASVGIEITRLPMERCMSSAEVRELAKGDLIQIGAHTVTHPVLSCLSNRRQKDEIARSKSELEKMAAQPVISFSYPYGQKSDYTATSVRLVQDSGFICGCTAISDLTWRRADAFQLPRLWIKDWDGKKFARTLSLWLGLKSLRWGRESSSEI